MLLTAVHCYRSSSLCVEILSTFAERVSQTLCEWEQKLNMMKMFKFSTRIITGMDECWQKISIISAKFEMKLSEKFQFQQIFLLSFFIATNLLNEVEMVACIFSLLNTLEGCSELIYTFFCCVENFITISIISDISVFVELLQRIMWMHLYTFNRVNTKFTAESMLMSNRMRNKQQIGTLERSQID